MRRINWHSIRLVLVVLMMIFLYSFSSKRNSERKINKIDIQFDSKENMFLTHQMVNNLLIQNLGDASRLQKDKVDLNTLENELSHHEMIEKAEVFSTIDGFLNTRITQKTPIIRVISDFMIPSTILQKTGDGTFTCGQPRKRFHFMHLCRITHPNQDENTGHIV